MLIFSKILAIFLSIDAKYRTALPPGKHGLGAVVVIW
jgi:hypothetical protein